MRFFTLTALLAAALFSAVVVVPFLPAAKLHSGVCALEIRLTSGVEGTAQLFYDDGGGYQESASSRAALTRSSVVGEIRLPLPPGRYRALRLDPGEREGSLSIQSLRILDENGRPIRTLALAEVRPLNQIGSLRLDGDRLDVVIAAGARDPQLGIAFDPPLDVSAGWISLAGGLPARALGVFAALAALFFLLDRSTGLRLGLGRIIAWTTIHPRRGVAVAAAVAVVASAYPVVFLGKSFVSPNLGTTLLYDQYPTLPGYKDAETTDVKLADIGAIMWSHIPLSIIQHRALAHGELPLWNRYNSAGTPLLAQGQSMFGDPLHFLVILADGAAWAWDLKFLLAKWLFGAALGLSVLELLGARPGAAALSSALIVAASTPFIGFFLYRYNHPAIFSVCYAPSLLYCWLRLTQAATRRALALWAAGLLIAHLALMNSGTAKEAYMLLLCMDFSGACVLLASEAPWRTRFAKLAAAAWAGVIFVLLTAPIWASFLQTLKNSYTAYNAASAYQIQPTLLLGLFDEIFYRPLMAEDRVFNPSLNFLLLLGFLYFLATLRLHFANRAVTVLAVTSLFPLALAFGLVPPAWIVQIPFLANVAHVDNTFTCALLALWSCLAGVGFATAAIRLGTREGRGDLAVATLLLFALVFGWVAFRQASHRPILGPTFTVNPPGQVLRVNEFIWGDLATLLAASVVLAGSVRRGLVQRTFTPALGLVVALAVVVLLWRHGFHARAVGFENYVARPTVRVDFHARSEAMEFVRATEAREPARGFGLRGNFAPGWTGVYGLETVHGPDALVNPFLRELITVSGVERIWDWRLYVDPTNVANARPFLDALNVRWYFDLQSDQGLLGRSLKLAKVADLDVYESVTAWPRAFFTDRVTSYNEPAELVQKIRTGDGRPFAAMPPADIAAHPTLGVLRQDFSGHNVTTATNYRLTENTTSFDVHATGPGIVVLNEAFWPGDFRAEVNGRKVPIVRTNHAFKGVVVDAAGDYRVTFSYLPRNFPWLLMMSGAGAALLAVSLFLALRPARPA